MRIKKLETDTASVYKITLVTQQPDKKSTQKMAFWCLFGEKDYRTRKRSTIAVEREKKRGKIIKFKFTLQQHY